MVCDSYEVRICNLLKLLFKSLGYELVEEFNLCSTLFKSVLDYILEHILFCIHKSFKMSKCHLGFDHPELVGMSLGVGILCSESRSKCVDLLECHSICLAMKLT